MSQVIPSNSPKEVLNKLKLEFGEARLLLHGTDMEKYLVVSMPCECEGKGSALVSYGAFRDIVAKLTGDYIQVSIDGDMVVISDGTSELELKGHSDVNEFPNEPVFEASQVFKMGASDFSQSLTSVSHCTDKEATRYALNSIYIQCRTHDQVGIIEFMATDGRRCAVRTGYVTADERDVDFSALMPITAVKCLPNVIDGASDEVSVLVSAEWIRAKGTGFDFFCRQTEGRFPNVKKAAEEMEGADTFEVDLHALRSIAAQGVVVSDDEARGLDMDFGSGSIKFKHESPLSRFSASIVCAHPESRVTVNSIFLQQALADCESVKVASKNNKLLVVRDDNTREVIMGMCK